MNTLKLSPKRSGEPITAVEWNRLVEELRRLKVVGGVGIRVHETALGTIISSDARPQRAIHQEQTGPWTITLDRELSEPGELLFKIQPGTLNGASDDIQVNSRSLNDPQARLRISSAGTHKVWLRITRDDSYSGTLVAIDGGGKIESGPSLPQDNNGAKYVELATITVTGAGTAADPYVPIIQQIQFNNIGYKACRSTSQMDVTDHVIWGV